MDHSDINLRMDAKMKAEGSVFIISCLTETTGLASGAGWVRKSTIVLTLFKAALPH